MQSHAVCSITEMKPYMRLDKADQINQNNGKLGKTWKKSSLRWIEQIDISEVWFCCKSLC